MLTTAQVQGDATAACRKHGAKIISDAAYAAMSGRLAPLQALGLGHCIGNLPALHLITTTAYALMSDDDQAMDAAQASINAAKLP
jgi:hypothetical protein